VEEGESASLPVSYIWLDLILKLMNNKPDTIKVRLGEYCKLMKLCKGKGFALFSTDNSSCSYFTSDCPGLKPESKEILSSLKSNEIAYVKFADGAAALYIEASDSITAKSKVTVSRNEVARAVREKKKKREGWKAKARIKRQGLTAGSEWKVLNQSGNND